MSEGNGGPAFPRPAAKSGPYTQNDGMTLRDYLAAKALQGMLAYPGNQRWGDYASMGFGLAAESAYNYADAMLKQREK